ncbi:MAG: metallophosphoesterase, partial [Tyzzerella sp.]|nr:metallophosphoesterase [Tyzzerella sp.]
VIILEDKCIGLDKSEETISLLGVNDPSFQTDYLFGDSETVMQSKLQEIINEEDTYTILLSHRPELFEVYTESKVDLVLSGHAHGGQFRLPFVGGLVAPNQGLFPKYDAGLYTEENTNMIVSKGIGNSILPFRFNNRPEVILIELKYSNRGVQNEK